MKGSAWVPTTSFRGPLILLVILAACFQAGCPLARAPRQSQVLSNSLPVSTSIPPVWDSTTNLDAVANDWLKSFNDPKLDAIVAEAIQNNLDLRHAAAVVEMARQGVTVVGSQLKPQLGGELGAATTRNFSQDSTSNSTMVYAGPSWQVDVWGRLRAESAAAQAGFEAASLDYAFARQSLAATTANNWYLAIETRQLVRLAERSVETYVELLKLARVRKAAGKVSDLDVAEANASLNQAQSELQNAQSLYSQTRRTLEVLLGRYPADDLEISQAFVPVPPPVRAGLPASLLERRPDVVASERRVLQAFRTVEASKLALRPGFTLTAEGGRLSDRILDLISLNPSLIRGAIQAFVPLYQGGELRAQIKIADARQEETLAAYGASVLNAFREVEVALTNETLLAARLQYQQATLQDRTEAVRIATLKYKSGAVDMLSVLQLQTDQIDSEVEILKSRYAQLSNRINLHLALGGSFDSVSATVPPNTAPVSFQWSP
jgi:NodT family efflux transporter outer membrane factor (OMF) lipoprotein